MQFHGLTIPENGLIFYQEGISPPSDDLYQNFFLTLYNFIKGEINPTSQNLTHIKYVRVQDEVKRLVDALSDEYLRELKSCVIASKKIPASTWSKDRDRSALMIFLWYYPYFANLISDVHLLAQVCIRATEFQLKNSISTINFVEAKALIDRVNRQRWSREQTTNERQSGVSNLGGVSELLLEKALSGLIDEQNFFRTSDQKIQSYGDFVLMCLPNNLWVSVKSNFARERLLASGYTTDIIGVGFFTDMKEFVSVAKLRNFQRVGFLAMYLPDIPISDEQIKSQNATYSDVVAHFGGEENLPLNINRTPFIRNLKDLHSDLERLLNVESLAHRTAIDF